MRVQFVGLRQARERLSADTFIAPRHFMIPFEENNLESYRLLLRIEIALRELLRQSFEQQYGPRWRNRLPGGLEEEAVRAHLASLYPEEHLKWIEFLSG